MLVEGIPAVTYIARIDGSSSTSYISPQIESMLGFSQEDYQSNADIWIQQLHPEDAERVMREVEETHRGKKSFSSEYRMKTRGGDTIWVTDKAQIINDEHGKPILMQGLMTNITEQKIYEESLYKHTAFIQKVIDGVSDGIMVIKPDYTISLMNDAIKLEIDDSTIKDPKHPKCYEISHQSQVPCDGELHQCPLNQVLKTGEVVSVTHKHLSSEGNEQFVDIIAAPLKDEKGNIFSIIESIHDVTSLLDIQRKLHEHAVALSYQAHHDELTKLPNRLLFSDRLNQSIKSAHRSNKKIAILFIDLDRFKEINDSMGHSIGDKVLIEIASLIQSCIRESDTLARLGGDEFIVLIENIVNTDIIATISENIIDKLLSPINIDTQQFYVTASIGISLYPDDGETTEVLIKNGDAAMYKAKEDGRNTYRYYTEEMTQKALEHISLEANLRNALTNNELVVYYQPQINVIDEHIIGMEALVRWLHPQQGLIPPNKFIPLAELTGLISLLGEQVLIQASKQLVKWKNEYNFQGRLAVNISTVQLEEKNFIRTISKILEDNKCQPEWIEFEVTEGYIMKNPEQAIQILQAIQDMGIKIAIDDFGTGYSSLSYLKKLPINKLKIDQSFVKDLAENEDDRAIVDSIISLAKSMKLNIIAEGVETKLQKHLLMTSGCANIQGYLYSKPLPSDELETFLGNQQIISQANYE